MQENLKIDKDNNLITISLKPEIYNLDTVYAASYVFLERAYLFLDGDPAKEIIVKLKPKESEDLEKLGGEFNNELINYGFYKRQVNENQEIRKAIVQRALGTNLQETTDDLYDNDLFDDEELDEELLAIPWEEDESEEKDVLTPWEDKGE